MAYALLDASSAGWGSTKIVALLGTAVILLGAFVASAVYLFLSALELALARFVRPLLGVESLEERDDAEPR